MTLIRRLFGQPPSRWIMPLWFAAVAVVPATAYYASFTFYDLDGYLVWYLLPIASTFVAAAAMQERFSARTWWQAAGMGVGIGLLSLLLSVLVAMTVWAGYSLSASDHVGFGNVLGVLLFGVLYSLLSVVTYFKQFVVVLISALIGGLFWYIGRGRLQRALAILSGLICGVSLYFLQMLPNPDSIIFPISPDYPELDFVDEGSFREVMSYGYEEKLNTYRTTTPIEETLDHIEQDHLDEGWLLVSRGSSSLEFQHPLSGFTFFVRPSDEAPDLIELTIRRRRFLP